MAKKKKKPTKRSPKKSTKKPVAPWTIEERREFADSIEWRTEPTRWAFFYLTDDKRQERTEEYVQETVASIVRGGIRLASSELVDLGTGKSKTTPISEETMISQTLMSITATRLDRSFGMDADHQMTCPKCRKQFDILDAKSDTAVGGFVPDLGFTAMIRVDWWQLADALLRRYVPEYVPSEVTHPLDQEPVDSDDLDDEAEDDE